MAELSELTYVLTVDVRFILFGVLLCLCSSFLISLFFRLYFYRCKPLLSKF